MWFQIITTQCQLLYKKYVHTVQRFQEETGQGAKIEGRSGSSLIK